MWPLAQTPLVLLDNHWTYISKKHFPLVEIWLKRGNAHNLDDTHDLAVVERHLWIVLLKAAHLNVSIYQLLDDFFKHEEVIRVIDNPNPLHLDTLRECHLVEATT